MSWLPMEDAPKDKRILVKRGPNNTVSIAKYNSQTSYTKPRPYWEDDVKHWGVLWMRDNPPTGWQHLPDPERVSPPAAPGVDLEQFRESVIQEAARAVELWMKDRISSEAYAESKAKRDRLLALIDASPKVGGDAPKYTTGHCENHKKPGGCPLHNLQCGYPQCDRKQATSAEVGE